MALRRLRLTLAALFDFVRQAAEKALSGLVQMATSLIRPRRRAPSSTQVNRFRVLVFLCLRYARSALMWCPYPSALGLANQNLIGGGAVDTMNGTSGSSAACPPPFPSPKESQTRKRACTMIEAGECIVLKNLMDSLCTQIM